ncbi:hypothetical protein OHS71_09060 [Streptomyces sp. NBC_00377]|nr:MULTISPECIES: hypothetical protein [unclassified Streptomyces]
MLAGLPQLLVLQLQDLHNADELLDLEGEAVALFTQRLLSALSSSCISAS